MTAHIERARVLIQLARYQLAEKELLDHLAHSPEDSVAHALLGLCLSQGWNDRVDEAEASARRAVHLAPESGFVLAHLAHVLICKGDIDAARLSAEEAVRLDPDDIWHFVTLALICNRAQRWQQAIDAAERGLRLDPNHDGCLTYRAMALACLNRPDAAEDSIKQALRSNPMNVTAHVWRGWITLGLGDPKTSLNHFKEAMRLDPTDRGTLQGLVKATAAHRWFYRMVSLPETLLLRLGSKWFAGLFALYAIVAGVALWSDEWSDRITSGISVASAMLLVAITWGGVYVLDILRWFEPLERSVIDRQRAAASVISALLIVGGVALFMHGHLSVAPKLRAMGIVITLHAALFPIVAIMQPKDRYGMFGIMLGSVGIGAAGAVLGILHFVLGVLFLMFAAMGSGDEERKTPKLQSVRRPDYEDDNPSTES